ncbi:MAG: hypothetical protein AB9M53_00830 [Leptothrix sp. (in: b-proteobacteria)]
MTKNGAGIGSPEGWVSAMEWSELESQAKLVSVTPPARDMTTARIKEVGFSSDVQPPTDSASLLSYSVEALLAAAGTTQQMFASYGIQDATESPIALITVTVGHPGVIDAVRTQYGMLAAEVARVMSTAPEGATIN